MSVEAQTSQAPQMVEAKEIQQRVSWKIPITFLLATILLVFVASTVEGDSRLRLNDRNQTINIDDITVNASGILWVFAIIAAVGTVWAVVSTLSVASTDEQAIDIVMMVPLAY